MAKHSIPAIFGVVLWTGCSLFAQQPAPMTALGRLPIREVTVFKDGHALVLHEGTMPTDTAGNVVMDYLPTPVIGTFWPYSSDKAAKLTSVVAGQRRLRVERTTLNLRELLEANTGAEVTVTETGAGKYPATIVGVPARSVQELEATSPPNSGEKLPEKGTVILLKTFEGVKVVAIDHIQDVTFKGEYKERLGNEEFRNLLTLQLAWPGGKPGKTASVGLIYLQKGVRWIPEYKITLDGKDNATVKLQATLLNELTDLHDVTANLVIGVPTFAFKETVDPISLQQAFAQLSPYFQESHTAQSFSNAIMTQAARMSERPAPPPAEVDLGPVVGDTTKSEDLFVFKLEHLSLKKGERMVVPVAEYALKYEDVYKLDLPFAPPVEVRKNINNAQQAELTRLLGAPKVMHKIRLANKGQYPLTTAPALILRDKQVLAQGMMTYTPIGASSDLDLTTAVDIQVKKSGQETKRTPNAVQWQGSQYARVDLAGTISLTNRRGLPVEVEVVRHVLGRVDSADHDGAVQQIGVLEDEGSIAPGEYPHWWGWYSWPYWWHHLNGIGRITWKITLEPGQSVDLGYTWHYIWQ